MPAGRMHSGRRPVPGYFVRGRGRVCHVRAADAGNSQITEPQASVAAAGFAAGAALGAIILAAISSPYRPTSLSRIVAVCAFSAAGRQDLFQKGLSMGGAGPQPPQGFHVLFGGIALMDFKKIARILQCQIFHITVSRHLGQNGRGRHGGIC